MYEIIPGALLIFLARVTDVSMGTFRTLMVVRGKRIYAAFIGFFEVIIYILALHSVVNTLDQPVNLIFYALGFATGNFMGSFLEEKMALGQISAQIIPSENDSEMIDSLREAGFGVTVFEGMGKNGLKQVLFVSLQRKDMPKLFTMIEEIDKDCFITVMDARKTRGGYYRNRRKGK